MSRFLEHAAARDGDAQALPLLKTAHAALDWKGETPIRTAGKDEQASSVTRAGGGDRQRPRKPDRRCFKPRRLLESRLCWFRLQLPVRFLGEFWLLSPGGWRASCPATYRPTHGHRHVRNW